MVHQIMPCIWSVHIFVEMRVNAMIIGWSMEKVHIVAPKYQDLVTDDRTDVVELHGVVKYFIELVFVHFILYNDTLRVQKEG